MRRDSGGRPICRSSQPRRPSRGFTLIELMIVTALLAIITTISVTSYRAYTLRANRTDAGAFLLRVAAAQEKWFLDNNAYTNDLDDLNLGALSEREFYEVRIELEPDPATGYTAIAEPVDGGRQSNDPDCQTFTIDASGRRESEPKGIDVCWR